MDAPSMVHRSGDTLIVRSVVSGNQLYFDKEKENEKSSFKVQIPQTQQQQNLVTSPLGCFQQLGFAEDENMLHNNSSRNSADQPEEIENQIELKDEGLPQCKIKRNYSCNSCSFFTQNPRYFLTHLRDQHGEKIVINECKLCLYASRHYQKLVRHMKMVHGSTEGIEENGSARKRQLGRETRKRKIENQSSAVQVIPKAQINSQQIHQVEKQSQLLQLSAQQEIQQQQFYKQQKVEEFLEDNSKNRLLKCSLCDFTTLYRSQLVEHETDEHCNAKFFRCEKCSYVTHIKARFSKHVKYHSMPMIKCFTCDFRTPYKWNLDRHMKNHGGAGAFKCAACNFTADIKQSLTVHEMNHHVPPVGHAIGMTNMRRRNKVGGTDISDDILSEPGDIEDDSNSNNKNNNEDTNNIHNDNNNNHKQNRTINYTNSNDKNNNINSGVTNICSNTNKNLNIKNSSENNSVLEDESFQCSRKKIKLNYEEDLPTDLSHKSFIQGSIKTNVCSSNKSNRPIPNLIPIQTGTSGLLTSKQFNSQNDNDTLQEGIHNLRQIASILFGKDIPQDLLMHLPQLSPCSDSNNSSKSGGAGLSSSGSYSFRKKSENVFNKLKQRFAEDEGNPIKIENLTCICGHTSKCLSELYIHRNTCQNVSSIIDRSQSSNDEKHSSTTPINLSVNNNSGSTRCQFCRHRCKSSTDLLNHLKNCSEFGNCQNDSFDSLSDSNERNDNIQTDEDIEKLFTESKHPMENRVFIWNDINDQNKIPADKSENIIGVTKAFAEKTKKIINKSDLIQLDNSNQYCNEEKNDEISYYGVETAPGYGEVTKKITSEEDAANASLKKVYKCPHCSFWASTASRFHVHIVGHLNKKPFECSLCNYRSNWRWDITKHIRLKTIRDPSHKNARVLMNDETGRRNYTKYNKYITLMKVTDEDGDPKLMKSGEMTPNQEASLSFLKDYDNKNSNATNTGTVSSDLAGTSFVPVCSGLSIEKKENIQFSSAENSLQTDQFVSTVPSNYSKEQLNKRSPPDLIKPVNFNTCKNQGDELLEVKTEDGPEKNKLYRCKECNYKHANRDMLVAHVKQHTLSYFSNSQQTMGVQKLTNNLSSPLQVKANSDYTNIMDMMAMLFQQQPGNNNKSEKDLVQQVQTFAALNLNLAAAAALSNQGNNSSNGNNFNSVQNEHGEMDEASSVGVVTTTTTAPTNNSSFSPNATASTNHLLNKKTQYVNNKQNNDICNNVTTAITSHSANTMGFGNSTYGPSNTSLIGGIISGSSSKNNLNTHSTIEQNINHNNFNNLLNHSNNMGNSGGHYHNNTDQWRGPAPYRCGHCHQVSNWKHVIQRHCRLKHNGDIRIETIDRSSDRFSPIYRPLGANTNHQPGRRSSQNLQNNQLSSQQNNENNNNGNSIAIQPLLMEVQDLNKNEKKLKSELNDTALQILPSGNSSKSKQQQCPQCPYVSESKSQMNYHISLHKAKQYECKICGLLFNKKQQLFIHTKHTHDEQQHSIVEYNSIQNIQDDCLKNDIFNKFDTNIDSSDNENDEDDEEGKLVIDLMSAASNINNNLNIIIEKNRIVSFCQECPTRFFTKQDLIGHQKYHQQVLPENNKLYYKCDFCSFKSRQEHSLLSHFSVHRQGYQDRTETLLSKYTEDKEFPKPTLEKLKDSWVVKNKLGSNLEEKQLTSLMVQSNTFLKKQLENKLEMLQQEDDVNLKQDQSISNDKASTIQYEKCSYCPFETNNSNIYKEHLKCHFIVSKTKSSHSCSHCDFSCHEEQDLKNHLKYHFNSINSNKTVAFFTSYNNLELYLSKNAKNSSGDNESTSNDLMLYKSSDNNINNIDIQPSIFDSGDNSHNENNNCKNVIDIKTGQIVAVESSPI